MKKLAYLLLLMTCIGQSSCTMVIKGLSKSIANKYGEHSDLNVSSFTLADKKGNKKTFADLYAGKTVYFYTWSGKINNAPGPKDQNYIDLKKRFEKYPDVVFAQFYIGDDQEAWLSDAEKSGIPNNYILVRDAASQDFRNALKESTRVPFIIGKNGEMLAFKGPKPNDRLLVNYVLYEARNGVNGTKSAKQLIRGINSNRKFKNKKLKDWYAEHFNADPNEELAVSISSTQ